MYSTCIYCHAGLGANEVIEALPVGRRVAFDGEKGRLWVVCGACQRWNLTPFEARWEALDACERTFRDTRLRVSTENVGFAKVREGLELIRIGRPRRPELAVWRYGDQLGARRRKAILRGAPVALGVAGALGALVAAAPLVAVVLVGAYAVPFVALLTGDPGGTFRTQGLARAISQLPGADGRPLELHGSLVGARITPDDEDRRGTGWALALKTAEGQHGNPSAPWTGFDYLLRGATARRASEMLLARANKGGGSRGEVASAVAELERTDDPLAYFAVAEKRARAMGLGYREMWDMPVEVRLALEMAVHEDAERRAMEGALAELERQWREAEEVAAIADRLVIDPKRPGSSSAA